MLWASYRFCSLSSQSGVCCHVHCSTNRMDAIPHSPLNLYTNPATRTLNVKNPFEYSWRVGFPVRAESDSLLSLAGWGWDSQHRRLRSGVACAWAIPMTAWLKIVACHHAEQSLDDLRGWIERCVAFSLHSIVMWKVPVLPVRNKINLTGGGLSKLLIVSIWHVFTPLVVCLEHEWKVLKQISVELYDSVQSSWFKVVCMVTEKKIIIHLTFQR